MKKLYLLLFVLQLVGCSAKLDYTKKHHVIYCGTAEFEKFEKKASIKKEQAWSIQNQITGKHQVPLTQWLFFVIDNYYVFTTSVDSTEPKTQLSGICVNAETGEIKYEKSGIMMKYKGVYVGNGTSFPFILKNKYKR